MHHEGSPGNPSLAQLVLEGEEKAVLYAKQCGQTCEGRLHIYHIGLHLKLKTTSRCNKSKMHQNHNLDNCFSQFHMCKKIHCYEAGSLKLQKCSDVFYSLILQLRILLLLFCKACVWMLSSQVVVVSRCFLADYVSPKPVCRTSAAGCCGFHPQASYFPLTLHLLNACMLTKPISIGYQYATLKKKIKMLKENNKLKWMSVNSDRSFRSWVHCLATQCCLLSMLKEDNNLKEQETNSFAYMWKFTCAFPPIGDKWWAEDVLRQPLLLSCIGICRCCTTCAWVAPSQRELSSIRAHLNFHDYYGCATDVLQV